MEFYRKDPSKAPASLRRQLDENRSSQEEQQRFIQQQEQEKSRINQRFDAELVPLRALWSAAAAAAAQIGRAHVWNSSHLAISYAVFCLKKKLGAADTRQAPKNSHKSAYDSASHIHHPPLRVCAAFSTFDCNVQGYNASSELL